MTSLDNILKKQRHYFANKVHLLKAIHLCMWEMDYKESWALRNWCFWTAVLEKTLESPLGCKEIQPVHPKGNWSWISIGRTDVEAELQYFGHLVGRTDWLEKTLMLGKIEGRRGRGRQRMKWLDGITDSMGMSLSKFHGQGSLAFCSLWGHKESDTTERMNWTELIPTPSWVLILILIPSSVWENCPSSEKSFEYV